MIFVHGIFLPPNFTNLHEPLLCVLMATCSVARIFTNSIFSAALGKIREISATDQVAIIPVGRD